MNRALLVTGLEAAAGGLTAALLHSVTGAGEPFRGTLVLVPLVVAALRALERHSGARRTPAQERWVAGLLAAGLVLLTLHRQRLGLVVTDWFLAAGFLLLLGHRAARLLVGLRPRLGHRLPRRPSWAFFVLPWIVYLAIQPWSSGHRQPDGDEPYYLLVAHSLAYDLDLDLRNNYAEGDWQRFMQREIEPQPGDPVGAGGEQYSRHSFLLPLVLAPAYGLAGRAGAMVMMAAFSALLAWMVLRLARHYVPDKPGAALLAYGIFAFSPPLLLYSYQVWVEVPAALLVALGLDRALGLEGRAWRGRRLLALALPIALLPVLKLRLGLLSVSLLALALWRGRPGRATIVRAAAGLAGLAAALAAFNLWRFDNLLRLYTWSELDLFSHPPSDFVRGAVGVFYDCAFGLFACAPVWLLVLPAIGFLWHSRPGQSRQGPHRKGHSGRQVLADAAVLAVPYLLLVAPRPEWYGGWSPPFRYPMVFLPVLALLLVSLLGARRRPGLRALIAALGAATLVLTVLWVVIPGWTYNFADGRSLFLDQASSRLGADVARFFPSTVRPRAATWWWLAGSLLLVPVGWRYAAARGPVKIRKSAGIWGLAAFLAALGVGLLASWQLPTRIAHPEDPWVAKNSGEVYPPTWVLQRGKYTGGWVLPTGGMLRVPVTPGSRTVTLRFYGRVEGEKGKAGLWIGAGRQRIGSWNLRPRWSEMTLGPLEWHPGRPLVIRSRPPENAPVIVDRIELEWQ